MSEKKDFNANTKYNRLIELDAEEETLRNQIRKRYKSFIGWGQKNLRIEITDKENVSAERFEWFMRFRELHDNCAGRKTRSKDTLYNIAIKKDMVFYNRIQRRRNGNRELSLI